MTATEIRKAEKTTLKSRPVFVQGIMQPALHELTAELDARVNGVTLRLPAGCVIGVTAGGAGGLVGSLLTEVEFVGRDGRTACQALHDEDPDAYREFGDHPDGLRRRAAEEALVAAWEEERRREPPPEPMADDVPF